MAKKGNFGNALLELPWIVRVLLAVFLDCIYGIARFVDGLLEGDILKALIGFLWIFYGFVIGWIADIICVVIKRRPFFL